MNAQELASRNESQIAVEVDSLTDSPKKVDLEEAIRERWKLHPLAKLQEIVAMLELDGILVPTELIEQLRQEQEAESRPKVK
jgi:GGDEF domain-containing protein